MPSESNSRTTVSVAIPSGGRSRMIILRNQLSDPHHISWARFDDELRFEGQYALEILASDP